MKIKFLPLLVLSLSLLINACAPSAIATATGDQATPITESVPPTRPAVAKIPAASFDAQTYINKEVGFAMEVPAQWTISESIIGDRGSQTKFLSSPEIADLSTLPDGATRISATIYQWEPKNNLAEYVAHWKEAWSSSGLTIQEEKKSVHEGGLDTVEIVLQNSDTNETIMLAAIGDQYLVVSGEGDMAMVKEILRTIRAVSIK